jgi:hypothetical protein
MQDFLLKYGLLLVAIVIAMSMAFFTYQALVFSDQPEEAEQFVNGNSLKIQQRIIELCDICLRSGRDDACFVLTAEKTDSTSISPISAPFPILESGTLDGAKALKIQAFDGSCVVSVVG